MHDASLEHRPRAASSPSSVPTARARRRCSARSWACCPRTATIHYAGGESLAGVTVEQRVARGMCLVPERRELFAAMSVADNLELGAFHGTVPATGRSRARAEEVYARFPRLAERRGQLAGTLSGGERQMLALGRALMAKPALLMLDEPSLGLAPLIVQRDLQHHRRAAAQRRGDTARRAERARRTAGRRLRLRAGDGRGRDRRQQASAGERRAASRRPIWARSQVDAR